MRCAGTCQCGSSMSGTGIPIPARHLTAWKHNATGPSGYRARPPLSSPGSTPRWRSSLTRWEGNPRLFSRSSRKKPSFWFSAPSRRRAFRASSSDQRRWQRSPAPSGRWFSYGSARPRRTNTNPTKPGLRRPSLRTAMWYSASISHGPATNCSSSPRRSSATLREVARHPLLEAAVGLQAPRRNGRQHSGIRSRNSTGACPDRDAASLAGQVSRSRADRRVRAGKACGAPADRLCGHVTPGRRSAHQPLTDRQAYRPHHTRRAPPLLGTGRGGTARLRALARRGWGSGPCGSIS